MQNNNTDISMICGIDTLYYFVETNENYDDLFLDILDQLENKEAQFQRKEIDYTNQNIFIDFKDITLQYLNKAEGYYWFRDINEYFKIGFKDENSNIELNNIRVQLQGVGIYTIGLKPLVSFINDNILKEITTGFYPITRADLNCFVNYDFSFIDKTMFASRKRRYMSISEFGSANDIQTIYVGKAPFMLRLYDKKLELEKSNKKELMYEYFANNGLDIEQSIFNIEFEMHRTHLKSFSITTLEDLFSNANSLFKRAMDDIRLIDISTITDKDIKNNSKNRAKSLPIWDYVKNHFSIEAFLQLDFPLKRLKHKQSVYDLDKFIRDTIMVFQKAQQKGLKISSEFICNLSKSYLDNLVIQDKEYVKTKSIPSYIDVIIYDKEGKEKLKQRLLKSGELITPLKVVAFSRCSDEILEKQIVSLENTLYFGEDKQKLEASKKLSIAYEERERREEVQNVDR